jgi:hypothetical protein
VKNCRKIKNKLVGFYYKELAEEDTAYVAAHIKNCSVCAIELKVISSVLEKISIIKRPKLQGSLYPLIKAGLEKRISSLAFKIWRAPFAVSFGLLIILSVFSNNQNISPARKIQVCDELLVSIALRECCKNNIKTESLNLDILSDDVFLDENIRGL